MSSSSNLSFLTGYNAEYIAQLYNEYLKNPASVDASWRAVFQDLNDSDQAILRDISGASWTPKEMRRGQVKFGTPVNDDSKSAKASRGDKAAAASSAPVSPQAALDSIRATQLINSYRRYGHYLAQLDPLGFYQPKGHPELDPSFHGFSSADFDRPIQLGGQLGIEQATLAQIVAALQSIYCGSIGFEVEQVDNVQEREWLRSRIEGGAATINFTNEEKKLALKSVTQGEVFETFLATKFVGAKRFGLDGGESMMPAIEEILRTAHKHGMKETVFGMAHRGRLNVLTNICGKNFTSLFVEFTGFASNPDDILGSGDVKYHMGNTADKDLGGATVRVSLTPNPSHLEFVNAVATGKVRGKQKLRKDTERREVLTCLMHGDAAFAGQGIVQETLLLSELEGYKTGGTIHIITNNQIGFTTLPKHARSGPYSSDIAKMLGCPIIHVNGDDMNAVLFTARLCAEYRQTFGRDVVMDLIVYRRNGHNEIDEPTFTQPAMYKIIKERPSCRTLYAAQLCREGVITEADADKYVDEYKKVLEDAFDAVKSYKANKADMLEGQWSGLTQPRGLIEDGKTSVEEKDRLKQMGEILTTVPAGFNLNPKIARQLEAKKQMFESGEGFDWATAEALALGTLIQEGFDVRLSGEDVKRGTFSHRHAVFFDQENNDKEYAPLQNVRTVEAFEVHNSPLSELAVLGYELGYTWADPRSLVIWEAQFGDFVNGAQVIIDQYIASAETKWLRMSGLVMLLPHGSEGQGPEHSSARPERFLQICAEDNMQVTNITTPANYFHALRRQMVRNFRKPLINMSPKSLLRHKLATSTLAEMSGSTAFKRVIDDEQVKADKVKRVVMCSGKVYYDLLDEREKRGLDNIALVRLEQLYPFPFERLMGVLAAYKNATDFIWCQEEPQNQGYWFFTSPRLDAVLNEAGHKGKRFAYAGRIEGAAPSTGYLKVHNEEQAALVKQALG
ncbi:MAG: 2-oxoglutarate dehydrogenase E1 component [Alphaproteobacteria bacterium]|nr:2-oxoglutarate dehydrogenase E1 component [Alphaproteobacteria bacterium]